jgi:anti-sigma factor RsiW
LRSTRKNGRFLARCSRPEGSALGVLQRIAAGLLMALIGGRLLPGNSGPVAQFMYHDASGQRLTLYVTTENAANRDTGFRFAKEGPVNVFYWIDGKFGYALSAGIDKGELARVATTVYDQLEHR